MVDPWAKKDMEVSGVLASITIAQAILESGWGTSELALHANNFFSMKTSLRGNTWETVWDGKSKYAKSSPEQDSAGNETMKISDFRAYPTIEDSIRDHSLYLTGARKADTLRFQGLAGKKDYQKAA
ncbi:MAG: glucosaminidase domain-containing protein [Lachnospiraceae bacterium]